mmetsp:Transcript_81986/g.198721  ORF Transcript_81986/g.198721 Transcript_81986/m.198721 type:complete len:561 (+) Transcript_81986:80-1762(+)
MASSGSPNSAEPALVPKRTRYNSDRHLSADAPEPKIGKVNAMERSLVAFDVDRTVLHQGDPNELQTFRVGVGRTLIRLARLGFKLAAITGNSISALSERFLVALLQELCEQRSLDLLGQFHMFCNGASIYIHFDARRCSDLSNLLLKAAGLEHESLLAEAKQCLFDDKGVVRPIFMFARYVLQCCIPSADAGALVDICNEEASKWWEELSPGGKIEGLQERFYIATGNEDEDAKTQHEAEADQTNTEAAVLGPVSPGFSPTAVVRSCEAADGVSYATSCNILNVLSFRHARGKILPAHEDPRMQLIRRIQKRLREVGLVRFIVSPGGRASIDICHHLVSKRTALAWLLQHLGLEGVEQLGEPMGTNAIYFGDEVVLNGNDLPVAEIPGVLVFAVNELMGRVPFRNNIEVPMEFTQKTGPEATQAVLESLADYAEKKSDEAVELDQAQAWQSVVATWKAQRLQRRLDELCAQVCGRSTPPVSCAEPTFRRLEAAVAALTALARRGEGLDQFADSIIAYVNNIGRVSTQVMEQQFESVHAQGLHHKSGDDRERALIRDLAQH